MENTSHILIVDDNSSLRKSMSLILKHKGYTVMTVQNGPEAIEEAKKHHFDFIFMDIKMPLMNGVETYKQIKKITPETLTIMMTAYAVEDLIQEALQEGAYGILYKPLDIDKVLALIEEAMKTRRGALILVVDDDHGMCLVLRNTLREKGYKVNIAYSGEKAIALVRKKCHDILFIDIKLPIMNGLETYLAIKEINPQAIAVMMTAYGQEMHTLVDTALNNHAYTCLYKPFEMEKVLKVLDQIQEQRRRDAKLK